MNYTRIALATVLGTLADFVYGYVVYGNLLTNSFLAQPGIYRSAEAQMANMPLGAAGLVLAMAAAVMLFAVSSFRGAAGGLQFGLLLAVFAIGSGVVVNYATIVMSEEHATNMVAAALGEWLLVGTVIGLVYQPRR
jgi:hypothetical protein